jgi:hypothetical protein
MEEDIQKHFVSPLAATRMTKKVEDLLQEAVDAAEERQEYESAHNEELLRALAIVAAFIQKKKRVCYGGTAMNAILPEKMRFYNPEKDLPDYDFYTPSIEDDVKELVADLQKAGFTEVYNKVGMHEGTKKILVNYTPVADISAIEPELFSTLFRRSILKDGIHYTDPDILRMMMYLELSRPKGEVSRWQKVFERLQLVNRAFPIRGCAAGLRKRHVPMISPEIRKPIIDYVIEQERILCNGPIHAIYEKGIRHGSVKFRDPSKRPGPPVLFVSPHPREDGVALKRLLESGGQEKDIRLFLHKSRGEIVPQRIELRAGNQPICLIVEEVACHSNNSLPLEDGRVIHIGSLEFLITLYLAIDIFTSHSRDILGERVLCDVADFMNLTTENYRAKHSTFPAFSLSCRGHQTGFASLLRAKVMRIKREREALEVKGSPSRKRKTRKAVGRKKGRGGQSSTRSKK